MSHFFPIVKRPQGPGAGVRVSRHRGNTDLWQVLSSSNIGKVLSRKRMRVNLVYLLLIASIVFTLINALMTSITSNTNQQSFFLPSRSGSGGIAICVSVWLATASFVALVTIVRKKNSNEKLLTRLRAANKRLEDEVQIRTEELNNAIKAKDHFLGVATHDLKAPLNGILGLVELVSLQNSSRSAEEREYLAHIEYSAKKMQRLVSDILEINRIDQGKLKLKRLPVDLRSLTNKLRLDFMPEAEKKSIYLDINLNSNAVLVTDADSLSRILENLLSNAIKFSPPMKMVSLKVTNEFSKMNFEVSDQGPGISPEERPKLFNKFQRLSNRPTNSESSTGLGLSIVKELTTQLGGDIRLISEVGKGSTFIVSLPQG